MPLSPTNSTPLPHCGMPPSLPDVRLVGALVPGELHRATAARPYSIAWPASTPARVPGAAAGPAASIVSGALSSRPRRAGRSSGCRGRSSCRCRNPTSGTTSARGNRLVERPLGAGPEPQVPVEIRPAGVRGSPAVCTKTMSAASASSSLLPAPGPARPTRAPRAPGRSRRSASARRRGGSCRRHGSGCPSAWPPWPWPPPRG